VRAPAATARLMRRETVLFRKTDDEAVLFDEDRGEAYLLNETGYFLFERIDGRATVGELVAAAVAAFDGESRRITEEVLEWIGEMVKNDILDTVP
jgi:hypothetical protein